MSSGMATQVDLRQLLAHGAIACAAHAPRSESWNFLGRDENGPAELALIEADPGLTGQVLRFLNSSYFGFSDEIASVKLAITMVGVLNHPQLHPVDAVFSAVRDPRCGPLSLKSLWQDSLRRGLFARLAARLAGMSRRGRSVCRGTAAGHGRADPGQGVAVGLLRVVADGVAPAGSGFRSLSTNASAGTMCRPEP